MPEAEQEKKVSWAELFFDLVFVLAVTEVSAVVSGDHSWAGLLRALVLFVPIYWLWVGTAVQTNQRDTSRPGLRIAIFGVALAATFMALALPQAYDRLGLLYALSYWIGRLVLGIPILRMSRSINPYVVSMAVTGPLLVVGAFTPGGVREGLWGLAAVLDLASPTVFRTRLRNMHYDAGHLAERFGLFVLIALGESVVAIGASAQSEHGLDVAGGFAVAAAFVLSCGLWWVYFHFAADAVRHALATAEVQTDITRLVLSYGHLSFIVAIVAVAVGLHDGVTHPAHHLGWAVAGLLYGGTALYLGTFGYTRWAMFRLMSWTRVGTALVVLALLPVAQLLPGLAALVVLAVVLIGLNVIELAIVEEQGWRALLLRRAIP